MTRLPLALLAVLLLSGCAGQRTLTEAQAAELAQARADVAAARAVAVDDSDPEGDAKARAALYRAAAARLMAGLADVDLPPPATPPARLVDPAGAPLLPAVEAEEQAATASEEAPPPSAWGATLAWAGGVGLLVLGVLRTSPGAFGLLANLAHAALAPKATRDMRAAQAKAMEVAQEAIAYGHTVTEAARAAGLGPTVNKLQEDAGAVQDRLGIRPQVQTLLAQAKRRRRLAAGLRPPPA